MDDAATVKAGRFVLVDSAGQTRAELGMTPDGAGPVLAFYDADGTPRVKVGVAEGTSGLSVYDDRGRVFAKLDVLEQALVLYNDEAQQALAVGVAGIGGLLVPRGNRESPQE